MLLTEIVRTCSHEKIADAAVASIGADFLKRVENAARVCNLSSGAFAARVVRSFSREASEDDWELLSEAASKADMPILAGMRHLLESALITVETRDAPPPWVISAQCQPFKYGN